MLLWISFALLAAAVAGALLLGRPDRGMAEAGAAASGTAAADPDAADPDAAVYRDQLAEIKADTERGTIAPEQAAAARAEVARRLITHAALRAATAPPAAPRAAGTPAPAVSAPGPLLLASAAAVPVLSLALYLAVGSPGLPGRPLAERLAVAPEQATPADMIAMVEARLRERPGDGKGWAAIAPVYLNQGRALDAADAYARAITLAGETPDRLAGLGKAHVMAGNGIVNEPARQAFERLLAVDPARVEARYWLAVADEQSGHPATAASTYRALLAGAADDAPWRATVEARLKALTAAGGEVAAGNAGGGAVAAGSTNPAGAAPPMPAGKPAPPVLATSANPGAGPTPAEFVAAAQKLAPEMREAMIGGKMIPKARDAVTSNPKDIAAWSRIVTGLMALGKPGDARLVLNEARLAVAGDASALAELETLARTLGLNS